MNEAVKVESREFSTNLYVSLMIFIVKILVHD